MRDTGVVRSLARNRGALTTATGDPMAYMLETELVFRVDVEHAARSYPLVAPYRRLGIEVPEPAHP
jgi:hypothetical protein